MATSVRNARRLGEGAKAVRARLSRRERKVNMDRQVWCRGLSVGDSW